MNLNFETLERSWHSLMKKMIIWGTQLKQKKKGFSSNLVYQENNFFSYD